MVGKDVVEGDVLDNVGVGEDELDILRAVHCGAVPEVQQRLLVLMDGDTGLRELGVEQLPEVLEIRTKEQLLVLGEEEVGHHLEVGDKLGGPVAGDVDILLAVLQQGQEELEDPPDCVEAIVGLDGVPELCGRVPGSAECLAEVRGGYKRDK